MTTNRWLTIVGWIGTMLVSLAFGRFAALDPRWDGYLVRGAFAGAAFILLSALLRRRAQPSAARGASSRLLATRVTAAVGVVVVVNALAGIYKARWDVTPNRVFQLSPETRSTLRMLDAPVHVMLFAEQAELPRYLDRLREYTEASRFVEVQSVDVDAEPALVRQYEIQDYGTAAIDYKGRMEVVKAQTEQDLTNALMRLREGRTRKAYFTTGHAERDIASTERVGYSNVASALQHENFVVEKVNLAQLGEVPSDATLLIAAGPRADFFAAEIDALRRYLARGGAVLFMVDPFEDLKRYITESGMALFMMDPASASATGELRNLTAFIREQGAELGRDVVVDTSEMGKYLGTDASVPVAAKYPPHPITDGFTSLSAYPMARSVTAVPDGTGRVAAPIIETNEHTWSETDIQQLAAGRLSMDADKGDRPGPLSLGVAVSRQLSGSAASDAATRREVRLVVIGDSDFVANYSSNVPGNSQIFLAIVHWLSQEHVVTIPQRLPQPRPLTMTTGQLRNVFWLAVLLLPGLAVGTGVWIGNAYLK
jgi:ABC-type uncharacterized transport system involved in gliding motility auxiliary subunit